MKHETPQAEPASSELRLIRSPEKAASVVPKLSGEELDNICRIDTAHAMEDFSEYFLSARLSLDQKQAIMLALVQRDFKNELPVEKPTFTYRRNLQECHLLRKKLLHFLAMPSGAVDEQAVLETCTKLLSIELNKADWLEDEFYPKLFDTAIRSARGDVEQFMIRQSNTKGLERFNSAHTAEIRLRDDLNFLLDGHALECVGVYSADAHLITLRIPEYYTDRDEWKVYLTAVHELLHSVSHIEYKMEGKSVGIDKRYIDPDLEKLNEAVTQLLTYHIALQHMDQKKTALAGQRDRRLSLTEMPYSQYTLIVRQIFSKIPMPYFTNAMLNGSGWEALRQKFSEEFGSENAVIDYARNLRLAYTIPSKRGARTHAFPFREKTPPPEPAQEMSDDNETHNDEQ